MCQSKAKGGRRCAAHLEQYATSGLVEYARHTSGLPRTEVKALYEMAKSSPSDEPEPTRVEVDNFLRSTASRVMNDPAIPPAPKQTIVTRLIEAIGRVKPSAATFRAWRSVVVDAWSKVRRQAAAGFVAAAMVVSVGACGNAPDQPAPDATAAPVAVATQAPAEHDTTYTIAEPTLGQPAISRYGREEVETGTEQALTLLKDIGYDETLVSSPFESLTPRDFFTSNHLMTDSCRDSWDGHVRAYLGSDGKDSMESVYAMSMTSLLHHIKSKDFSEPETGPMVTDPRITKVETSLASDGSTLTVDTVAKATVRVNISGEPHTVTATKDTQIFLVRDADGWQIDGWRGQVMTSSPVPEAG